jgi:probable HAF family extracellular repeat protein
MLRTMHQTLRRHGATVVAALSIVVAPVPAAAQYQAYRLGVGVQFFGYQGGMNALGWVAANGPNGPLAINPITGHVRELGLLAGGSTAFAHAINDAGVVVGNGDAAGTAGNSRAILWDAAGTPVNLGTLDGDPPFGRWSAALGINNVGDVVGFSSHDGSGYRAARWNASGTPLNLGALPGGTWSYGRAINDAGSVAGYSNATGMSDRAVRWDATTTPTNIGTLPAGLSSVAYSINSSGQIVGAGPSLNFSASRAIRWDVDGNALNLGVLNGDDQSAAFGINSLGHIVGSSQTAPGVGVGRAFVWQPTGGMLELEIFVGLTGSWTFSQARSINDRGDILAFGRALDTSSPYEGWVVLHDPSRVATVPEPAVLSLLAIGLSLILAIGSRRLRMAMESDEA